METNIEKCDERPCRHCYYPKKKHSFYEECLGMWKTLGKPRIILVCFLGIILGIFSRKIIAVILVFGVGVTLAAVWTTFKGGPERLGVSEEIISPPFSLKWSSSMCSVCDNFSSVVVDSTQAYAALANGHLDAFNVATGEKVWGFISDFPIDSTPTVEGSKIYFSDENGKFYARNTLDGSEVWTYDAGMYEPLNISSVTDGTNIYFGSGEGKIYALKLTDGSSVWSQPFDTAGEIGPPAISLAIAEGRLYIATQEGRLYSIKTSDGIEDWHTDLEAGATYFNFSSAAIVENRLYIGTSGGRIYIFNRTTGAQLGFKQLTGEIIGTPTIVGGTTGTLYIGTAEGYFYSYNLSTLAFNWIQVFDAPIMASPIYANGYLFVGADGFYVLNASTGEVVWNYNTGPIGYSTPAIANGLVYILSNSINSLSAKLYVFEPSRVQAAFVQKWIYDTGENTLKTSNLVADSSNNIYVGAKKLSDNGNSGIYSVNSSGAFRWKFTPGGIPTPSLTVDNANGALFYGNGDSKIYAVNTSNGTQKCVYNLNASENEKQISPGLVIPAQGIIVGGTNLGMIAALNLSDCTLSKSYNTERRVNLSQPIRVGSYVWFNQGMQRILGFDSSYNKVGEFNLYESGDWFRLFLEVNIPIILAKNVNTIYAGGTEAIYAIDVSTPSSPSQVWKYTLPYSNELGVHSVVYDSVSNTVVGVSYKGTVYGINASTGAQKWVYHDLARTHRWWIPLHGGQPIVFGDVVGVMIGSNMVVLSIENGQLRSSFTYSLVKTAPIIVNNILALATSAGKIVAVDVNNYSMNVTASLGGTLSTVYGDFLEILANALGGDKTITLAISNNDQTPPIGTVALPRKYDYGPHGTSFSPNATAKFAYKDSDLKGEPEQDIRVFAWDNVANTWTAYSGTLDTTNKKFIISLAHFSEFMMVAGIPLELNVPVFANEYQYGAKVVINYSAVDENKFRWMRASLNNRHVENGQEITLTEGGENVFKVIAMTSDGELIEYSDTFEVVGAPERPKGGPGIPEKIEKIKEKLEGIIEKMEEKRDEKLEKIEEWQEKIEGRPEEQKKEIEEKIEKIEEKIEEKIKEKTEKWEKKIDYWEEKIEIPGETPEETQEEGQGE